MGSDDDDDESEDGDYDDGTPAPPPKPAVLKGGLTLRSAQDGFNAAAWARSRQAGLDELRSRLRAVVGYRRRIWCSHESCLECTEPMHSPAELSLHMYCAHGIAPDVRAPTGSHASAAEQSGSAQSIRPSPSLS